MARYDYAKLMALNPFRYDGMINSKNQTIEFYEHPTHGDASFVICVCHAKKLAADSDFFETDDMMAEHGEYEPWFDESGKLQTGNLSLK